MGYTHLMTQTHTYPTIELNTRETAAEMRATLRATFPSVKFSVRIDTGTAYGWISIQWTDGPTTANVDTLVRRFQSSYFDGRDDATHSIEPSMYLRDGVLTIVRYSCRGVSPSRRFSAEAQAWARAHADYSAVSASDADLAEYRVLATTDLRQVL